MVSIGTGVAEDIHLHGRQRTVGLCTKLHRNGHRVAGGSSDELFFAGELPLNGSIQLQCG